MTLTWWKIKTGDRLVLVPLLQYINLRHASMEYAASMKLQLNLDHKPADDQILKNTLLYIWHV